jgi:hypothetical protein
MAIEQTRILVRTAEPLRETAGLELTPAPGIGCFVPQLPLDPPDATVLSGTCGSSVRSLGPFDLPADE